MKTLVMVVLSTLMLSPAMAFDQADLDNINSYTELAEHPGFNAEGFLGGEEVDVEIFRKRRFTCVSENGRGLRFRAQGPNKANVRRRAMRKCRRNSFRPRSCYIVRCKRRGGKFQDFIDLIDLIDLIDDLAN